MDITRQNSWWITGEVAQNLKGKDREAFRLLIPYLDKRQALLLKGLRRVGKTTLLYMLIDFLIKERGIDPYNILYFSFDEEVEKLEHVLEEFRSRVFKKEFAKAERLYVFLDEVQKLKDWANQLKLYYDLYPDIKFIISGSAALGFLQESKESLAGRIYDFHITPLDFKEYLTFKEIKIDLERIDLSKDRIIAQIQDYLRSSGFIEMIHETDERILEKYFKESILERVVFRDIPEIFGVKEPSLLLRLLKIIAAEPGMIVEYKHLAADLQRDQRTISQYFDYLKYALLVKPLYHYSRNMLTSEKKGKKYYLSIPAFTYFLAENRENKSFEGKLIENLFVSLMDTQFFYRSPTREEVDLIKITDSHPLPVEIKYRNRIDKRDMRGINSFMKKYSVSKGIAITKEFEGQFQLASGVVNCIPCWKYIMQDSLL